MRSLGELLEHIVLAIAVWALGEELKSGTSRLSRRLLRAAATGLAEHRRNERLRDWLAELDHYGPIFSMNFAVGLWISYRVAPAAQSPFDRLLLSMQLAAKRSFDLSFSLIGVVAYTPILLAIAVVIAVDSPGPIFYRAKRVGRAGRQIGILKFRTIHLDAHERFLTRLARDPVAKEKHQQAGLVVYDPRLTKVGRFLRRLGLDELPQLFHVVRGDLSLVGPRPDPCLPKSIGRPESDSWTRHAHIRPGLTGL